MSFGGRGVPRAVSVVSLEEVEQCCEFGGPLALVRECCEFGGKIKKEECCELEDCPSRTVEVL